MRTREFDKLYPKYINVIWALATKLSRNCLQLRQDLVQEGLVTLKSLQPARARNPDPYIRQSIKYRMIDFLRYLKQDQFMSFERAHELGYELECDPISGAPLMRRQARWIGFGGALWQLPSEKRTRASMRRPRSTTRAVTSS